MYLQHEQFTTAILVGPDLNSENLVFPLSPEGVISGEVTDEAGEPVQSARMLLFREDTEIGRHVKHFKWHAKHRRRRTVSIRVAAERQLLSRGVGGALVCGVRANLLSFRGMAAAQKSGPSNPSLDLVYPITYYPNATDVAGAASIRVETGGSARADMRSCPCPRCTCGLKWMRQIRTRIPRSKSGKQFSEPIRIGRAFRLERSCPTIF